jgi:hypothetical protein
MRYAADVWNATGLDTFHPRNPAALGRLLQGAPVFLESPGIVPCALWHPMKDLGGFGGGDLDPQPQLAFVARVV